MRRGGGDAQAKLGKGQPSLRGPMAEGVRRGLQILARRFDSGSGLHPRRKSRSSAGFFWRLSIFEKKLLAAHHSTRASLPRSTVELIFRRAQILERRIAFASGPEVLATADVG